MEVTTAQATLFDVPADGPTAAEVEHEFFPTPIEVTMALLPHLDRWFDQQVKPFPVLRRVIEPAAGRGAICQVLRSSGVPRENLLSVDIRPDCQQAAAYSGEHRIADWLEAADQLAPTADLIITNPPFSRMQEFAEATLPHMQLGATLALFGRVSFTATEANTGRASFHLRWPSSLYVLSWRPKFVKHLDPDRWDYAWFVWTIGVAPHPWTPLLRPTVPVAMLDEWQRVQWGVGCEVAP